MAVSRYYSSTAVSTALTTGASDVVTTLAVAATTGFPASTPFTLILEGGTANEEVVEVTGVAGLNLTVTRGVDSTTAVAHALGASVEHGISARDLRDSREHEDDTTAHGATGAVVGTTNTQVLTNKTMSGASNTFSAIPESAVTNLVSDLAGKAASTHAHPESDVTGLVADLAAKQDTSAKGAASGYASLDGSAKVPIAQIPTGSTSSTVPLGNHTHITAMQVDAAPAGSNISSGGSLVTAVSGTFTVTAGVVYLVLCQFRFSSTSTTLRARSEFAWYEPSAGTVAGPTTRFGSDTTEEMGSAFTYAFWTPSLSGSREIRLRGTDLNSSGAIFQITGRDIRIIPLTSS